MYKVPHGGHVSLRGYKVSVSHSVRVWCISGCLEREPLKLVMAERRSEKEILQLNQLITTLYDYSLLMEISAARRLYVMDVVLPITRCASYTTVAKLCSTLRNRSNSPPEKANTFVNICLQKCVSYIAVVHMYTTLMYKHA